ncbi:hypothetical protein [Sabulibacter ruber]|uniref:hypothetical protein n=1 Tax=Sabulibacter ruber TaxID=2811901 RepID=UPI001A9615F4|nr:hypothetical protein [Sabulibacter ruber]
MKINVCLYFILVLQVWLSSCSKLEDNLTEEIADPEPMKIAVTPMIQETSGMADSKSYSGYIWVHEDSGNPTQLFLLEHSGRVFRTIFIEGVKNRDWEDMALVGDQLYLADIGDNSKTVQEYTIYQFKEPSPSTDTVKNITPIRFRYPDGSHDAEAFLVDPKTKDILLLTKQDSLSAIYKLSYPYSTTSTNVAELVGNLPYPFVVSAAISRDGKEAIVKTYSALYHYRQKTNEPLAEFLLKDFKTLPYRIEPQGEAVTFAAADSGYFTLSEKGMAAAVSLYFYKWE